MTRNVSKTKEDVSIVNNKVTWHRNAPRRSDNNHSLDIGKHLPNMDKSLFSRAPDNLKGKHTTSQNLGKASGSPTNPEDPLSRHMRALPT
jgi:hypothetical protein